MVAAAEGAATSPKATKNESRGAQNAAFRPLSRRAPSFFRRAAPSFSPKVRIFAPLFRQGKHAQAIVRRARKGLRAGGSVALAATPGRAPVPAISDVERYTFILPAGMNHNYQPQKH